MLTTSYLLIERINHCLCQQVLEIFLKIPIRILDSVLVEDILHLSSLLAKKQQRDIPKKVSLNCNSNSTERNEEWMASARQSHKHGTRQSRRNRQTLQHCQQSQRPRNQRNLFRCNSEEPSNWTTTATTKRKERLFNNY